MGPSFAQSDPFLEANMQALTIDRETALIPRKSERGRRIFFLRLTKAIYDM